MSDPLPAQTAKLAAWYAEHGESASVAQVEAALTDDWISTADLAAASGRSRKYVATLMPYLHAHGRAEVRLRAGRREAALDKPVRGQQWRWEWRAPTPKGTPR